MKATATALGLSWGTVNKIALTAARELTCNPEHLAGVRKLGVDEHKWKHVRGNGDFSWVTVLVDLTPVGDGTGPARLLDMVAGRSAQALRASSPRVARRARSGVPEPDQGHRNGRVLRLSHRRSAGARRSTHGDGSLPHVAVEVTAHVYQDVIAA